MLALRTASASNGVSKLHGEVSRGMWKSIWPGVPEDEVPIGHVTNGVHFRSWISHEMNQLYDRYLGPKWREEHADANLWRRVESIPAEELWRSHERRRERLVAFARRRLRIQLQRRGAPQSEIDAADEVLDPDALTIGFARRFATYKRASLVLSDVHRLQQILNQPGRPVQIVFAGKAHPRDDAGKALIQQVVKFAQQKEFRRRLVFLEDYDMAVARYLVQGSDIWLNTPLRPLEALGLEPTVYHMNEGHSAFLAVEWVRRLTEKHKLSFAEARDVASAGLIFTTHTPVPAGHDYFPQGLLDRYLGNYIRRLGMAPGDFYGLGRQHPDRQDEDFCMTVLALRTASASNGVSKLHGEVSRGMWKSIWPGVQVRIDGVDSLTQSDLQVGSRLHVRARVQLGALTPGQVSVELYVGRLDADGELTDAHAIPMQLVDKSSAGGVWAFEAATVPCLRSGLHGYTLRRITPFHVDEPKTFLPDAILWADAGAKAAAG